MRLIPHVTALCLALLWIVATLHPEQPEIVCYYADHTRITDSSELYPILRTYSGLRQTHVLPQTHVSIQTSLVPGISHQSATSFERFKHSLSPTPHYASGRKRHPVFALIVTDNHTGNILALSSNFSNVKTDPTRSQLFLARNKNMVDLLMYLEKGHHPLEFYPDQRNSISLKSAFNRPLNFVVKGLETAVSERDRRNFHHRLGWLHSHFPGEEVTLPELMSLFSAIRLAGNITPPNLITQVTHFNGKILYRKTQAEALPAITAESARSLEKIVRYDDHSFSRSNFPEFSPHPTAGLRIPIMESGICLVEIYPEYTFAIYYRDGNHKTSTETRLFRSHMAQIVNAIIAQLHSYKLSQP